MGKVDNGGSAIFQAGVYETRSRETGIGNSQVFVYLKGMPKATVNKPRHRTEDEILDQATQQLLKATKEVARKRNQPINDQSLRRDGYGERFIEKVRQA